MKTAPGTSWPSVGLHLGLGLLLVGSVLPHPLSSVLGSGDVDVWNHAWGAWWWWDSLSSGRIPWHTDLLRWPGGGTLWFIDPLTALVGAPLVPLLGAAGAWNLTLWLWVSLASWSAHRLARSLGAGPRSAWVASAAYAGSAWLACELHNGISEATNIGPVALTLAWGEDAVQARTKRAWVKVGFGLGLVMLGSPYLGLGVAVVLGIRGLPHLRHAWAGGLVGTALTLLPAAIMHTQFDAIDAIVRRPDGMNESLALHNAVDPRTFVAPLGFRSVDLSAEGFEHSMYMGLLVIALAIFACWRHPRRALPWMFAAVVAAVLSLGPWLFYGHTWVLTGSGARIGLPWGLVQQLLPSLAMTHPLRLAVVTLAVFAGLAAVGADALLGAHRAAWLVPAVLFDGLIFSGAPWPVATADARLPAVFDELRASPGGIARQAVLDLPTDAGATMATSRYLFWQTGHHRPIPYAVDARATTSPLLDLAAFRALALLCERRPDENAHLESMKSGDEETTSMRQLATRGIRWIVLHRDLDPLVSGRLESRVRANLGLGRVVGNAVIWDLGEEVRFVPMPLGSGPPGSPPAGPPPSGPPPSGPPPSGAPRPASHRGAP